MDCMLKSRNSKTLEELQYDRIDNRQTNRRSRKKADSDDEKGLLEWVGFFKQNKESKKILKRRSVEMFYRCEEFERKAVKEDTSSDDDEENEEKAGGKTECTCDYDVDCPACTAVLEDEKGLQDDYQLTAEDEAAENKEYKAQEQKIRREKREEMVRKSKIPLAALPERENQRRHYC